MELENEKYCGEIPTPFTIITNTNNVNLRFTSDGSVTPTGFLAVWTASTEPPPTPTGCDSCIFPFVFGETTFDTCISVQDVDTQPWCSYDIIPPVINTPSKITCSDSDSSCPSSPPQTVITSPNYPESYPTNADQVK